MDKLLKALTVVLLLLSIAALVLGMKLFGMREVLKGRAEKLENAIVALGAAIEKDVAAPEEEADFPEKDTSDCDAEILAEPARSDIWEDYDLALEHQENPTMKLQDRRTDLMSLFKKDPITGDIMRDAAGLPVTEGEGTMEAVLQDLLSNAVDQYKRLNQTRQSLMDVRKELVAAIEELNNRKGELRESLVEAKDLRESVDPLKQQIAQLTTETEELEEEKEVLENRILEQKDEIARKSEEALELRDQIDQLENVIANLEKKTGGDTGTEEESITDSSQETEPEKIVVQLATGEKGRVAAVNEKWKFVILDLQHEFLQELLGDDLTGTIPSVELMVRRRGMGQQFVTKIKLTDVKADQKLAVADILADWQQLPVEEGDVVLFRE